jgi:hypothetical protein
MTPGTIAINPRDAARQWIADTIHKHLHPELGGADRIHHIAAAMEAEADKQNLPIEMAVCRAVAWSEEQNEETGLSYASQH